MQINIINFIIHKVFTVFLLQINSLYIRSDVIQRESYKSKAAGKLFFFFQLCYYVFLITTMKPLGLPWWLRG